MRRRSPGFCGTMALLSIALLMCARATSLLAAPGAAAAPNGTPDWSVLTATKPEPAATPTPTAAPAPAAPNVAPAAAASHAAPVPTSFDSTAIRRSASSDSATGAQAPAPASSGSEIPRVCFALAIVLGLIFFLRWGSRRIFAAPGANRPSRAVQVLSRSVLTPKQHLLVLRVGQRVLVVADGGSQMSSLCQITEPDEVASLLGQLQNERDTSPVNAFGTLFGRIKRGFEGADEGEPELPSDDTAATNSSTYADDHPAAGDMDADAAHDPEMRRSRADGAAADETSRHPLGALGAGDPETSSAVEAAREQLSGLRERLRRVSRQFNTES